MNNRRRGRFLSPPRWTSDQLELERVQAVENFRVERMQEPLELYLQHFEQGQRILEDLLETTVDFEQLDERAIDVLGDSDLLDGARYLVGPPISIDDLKVVADSPSFTRNRLEDDPELVLRVLQILRAGLDRRRFPWVSEGREPTEAERNAAILASAALMAMRRTETSRRSSTKQNQENRVHESLVNLGFTEIPTRSIGALGEAPGAGEFCRESMFGERKADFIVGLWDTRTMAIECKVSNSSTNSVKRLNNDAAVKAELWIKDFGALQIVPVALLSGVYKLHNLENAQARGLTLYWAHKLEELTDWINQTNN